MVSKYLKWMTRTYFAIGTLIGISGAENCQTFKGAAACVIIMCLLYGLGVLNTYATEAVIDMETKK